MAANSSSFTDPVGRWPDTEETAAWDALIGQSACGNRFLKSDCLKMLQETDSYGTKFSRISLRDASGKMLAAWALPYRQHLGFRYATYFDFFYAGPVLAREISATKDRMDLLAELARGQEAFLPVIETEAHLKFNDGRGLQYAGFTLQQLYTNLWDFSDPTGNTVIPGLYWHACQEVYQAWGAPMTANFGGSPRPSLAVFKDSLGSQVAAHLRLTYERPGLQTRAWKHLRRRKEDLRWLLSKTGALSLISNRPRKEVPPVEMEIQADA